MPASLMLPRADAVALRMSRAAQSLLDAMAAEQRAALHFPFAGSERYAWAYTPGPRNGLQLRQMTEAQRLLVLRLFDAGLSARGSATAQQIIALEMILRETERIEQRPSPDERDPGLYYVSVFGTPGGSAPWGWRVNGHHLALNFTVIDGELIAPTPLFFGSNPATVHHGAEAGLRVLAAEEDLARTLLGSLAEPQKAIAIVDQNAPWDILTKNYRVADPGALPHGITYGALDAEQRGHLVRLIRHYIGRSADELHSQVWAEIERAGLEALSFAWAGPETRGHGHYYAVKGATFLIEYDNTQNNANHIHSVWRDASNDWGEDVLAQHYAHDHHHDHHHE